MTKVSEAELAEMATKVRSTLEARFGHVRLQAFLATDTSIAFAIIKEVYLIAKMKFDH